MAISFIALPFMQKEETSKGGHQLVLALIIISQ
ncbi:unknown [Porphyromonas sp. CAG:1061]|nr:unknown [Porphyromonas sp. CAG:1061]